MHKPGSRNKPRCKASLARTQRKLSLAAQAREAAGYSLDEAARRARISRRYLQQIENAGNASWVLAERLAHLYDCSPVVFLQGR